MSYNENKNNKQINWAKLRFEGGGVETCDAVCSLVRSSSSQSHFFRSLASHFSSI